MSEKTYSNDEVQVVAFKLAREEYGVDILNVQEIKKLTDITRVPYTPDFIKGVMNLRGSVLPVIDLKKRLSLVEEPYSEDTRIIIVKVDDISVGMIVDAVTEVLAIGPESIEAPEAVVDGNVNGNNFISGVGNLNNRLVIMLKLSEIIGLNSEVK